MNRTRRDISWTELGIAFVALFGGFAFQALGGWWMLPSIICILVAVAAVAD